MIFHWFGVPFGRNLGRFSMIFRLMFYRSSFIYLAWCLIYFWVFCCFCFRLGCCCVLLCKIMPFLPFVFRGSSSTPSILFKVTLFQSPLWGTPITWIVMVLSWMLRHLVGDVARQHVGNLWEGGCSYWMLVAGCCWLSAGCWLLVRCRLVGTREANRIFAHFEMYSALIKMASK